MLIGSILQSYFQRSVCLIDSALHFMAEHTLHAQYGKLRIQGYQRTYLIEPFRIRIGMSRNPVPADFVLIVVVNIYLNHDLCFDRSDLNLSIRLTMTLAFAIVGFCSVFENKNLISFALFSNFSSYFSACNSRIAYLYIAVVDYSQNIVKNDFLAFFNVQFFDVQHITFTDAVLFAAGTNNCVHVCTSLIQDSPNTVLLPEFQEPLRAVVRVSH